MRPTFSPLTEREERILDAVIRTYVETAEPAGSRTVAKRHGLGVSPATIRNTMSDLEDKGYLFHPHTSAGRVPTDQAYRYYVDTLMRPLQLTAAEQRRVRREFGGPEAAGPLEQLIRRAAQVLGLVTGELGVAVVPRLDEVKLERIELVAVASDRVLIVMTLAGGVVRAIYVNVPTIAPAPVLATVASILNERLGGLQLSEIRSTLPERLRDTGDDPRSMELLNIFVQSASELLEPVALGRDLLLGRTSVLAQQPEFSTESGLKSLIELTEQSELLATVLNSREHVDAPHITIGAENPHPKLAPFTIVTSEYRFGNLTGVVGVMGPTRMPYDKVSAIVEYTSLMMNELAGGSPNGGSGRAE